MTSTTHFHPNWASAPGETISDILRERNIPFNKLVDELGESVDRVKELLDGRLPITISLARQLKQTLGASVEFWMARDFEFRQSAARLEEQDRKWLAELPVRDMVKFGW